MTAIKANQVAELRQRTGLGLMECKKALVQAEGDIEKAITELRKNSGLKAAKKAGRVTSDGAILLSVSDDGSYGVMVEINCETDFVARDENFLEFARLVTDKALNERAQQLSELITDEVEKARQELVQKVGENIAVSRMSTLTAATDEYISSYLHGNKKLGVLVLMQGERTESLGRDIAMHITASDPLVVKPEDIAADVVEREREIYQAQAASSGKPQAIIEKMVAGRIKKYLNENSLIQQPFVRDPQQTVGALLKSNRCSVTSFVRFELG